MPNPGRKNTDFIFLYSLEDEIRFFRKIIHQDIYINTLTYSIGVGKAHSLSRLDSLSKSSRFRELQKIILVGFCGGLNPCLNTGDIVEERRNSQGELLSGGSRIFSSDSIVETTEAKIQLHESSGLDAVDMESAAVREFARSEGLGLHIIKSVLDEANFRLGVPAHALFDLEAQKTPYFRLARHVASNPTSVGRLIGLALRSRKASRALALRVQALLTD